MIDESTPPMLWKIGIIVYTYQGEDNLVRVVAVKNSSGVYRRAVNKMFFLCSFEPTTTPHHYIIYSDQAQTFCKCCSSTMSASLNTVAGTIYEDFVLLCFKQRHSDAVASFAMKCIVLVLGAVCVALVLVVEKLGGILQMAISLSGITYGALAFVFSFGMFYPWANSKGAMAGLVASLLGTSWIVAGAQAVIAEGRMKFPGKITSVDGCPANSSINHDLVETYTGVGSPVWTDGTVDMLYQVSYIYYAVVGMLIGVAVGVPVSHLTGAQDLTTLDPDLLVPQIRSLLPPPSVHSKHNKDYVLVPVKLNGATEKESANVIV